MSFARPALPRVLATALALASLVAAAPATAAAAHHRASTICVSRRGALHLRGRVCRRGEGRLDLSRATRASSSSATVETCVTRVGAVRIVSRRTKCKRGERRLIWSVEGKPGPKGEKGLAGERGPKGETGETGPAGSLEGKIVEQRVAKPAQLQLAESEKEKWTVVEGLALTHLAHNYIVTATISLEATGSAQTQEASVACRLVEKYTKLNEETKVLEQGVADESERTWNAPLALGKSGKWYATGQLTLTARYEPGLEDNKLFHNVAVECERLGTEHEVSEDDTVFDGVLTGIEVSKVN